MYRICVVSIARHCLPGIPRLPSVDHRSSVPYSYLIDSLSSHAQTLTQSHRHKNFIAVETAS